MQQEQHRSAGAAERLQQQQTGQSHARSGHWKDARLGRLQAKLREGVGAKFHNHVRLPHSNSRRMHFSSDVLLGQGGVLLKTCINLVLRCLLSRKLKTLKRGFSGVVSYMLLEKCP